MRKLFLTLAVIGMFLGAQPAHAQSAIARHLLLEAAATPLPPPAAVASACPPTSSGSQHGVCLSWTAATQGSDTNPIAGYNAYRIASTSTCSASLFSPLPTPINSAIITPVEYLDPSSGLAVSTQYCYGLATVDSIGNQSALVTAGVTTPATFPVNANAATTFTPTVQ